MIPLELREFLKKVNDFSDREGCMPYIVGGFIRDILLGVPCDRYDIDFVLERSAAEFSAGLCKMLEGELKTFDTFLTFKISGFKSLDVLDEIDVATARTEIYSNPGSLPVVTAATLEEDLRRRDFTINAMAVELSRFSELLELENIKQEGIEEILFDPFSGLKDLKNRKVRILHPNSFVDDPTRIFRAARYVTRIDGSFEESTKCMLESAISQNVLSTISDFRKATEIKKIFEERDFPKIFGILSEWGVLRSCEFFEAKTESDFLKSLNELPGVADNSESHVDVFEAGKRLLCYFSLRALDMFLKSGISKQRRIRLISDIELLKNSKIDAVLSKEAVVAQVCLKNLS